MNNGEKMLCASVCHKLARADIYQAVGTRGDIQPFIAVGARLREAGYRVRLATHAVFREFVVGACAGLEFFPLGGDPVSLARCAAETGGRSSPLDAHVVVHWLLHVTADVHPNADAHHAENLDRISTQASFRRATSRRWMSCGARCAILLLVLF